MDPIYVVSLIIYALGSVGMFFHIMSDDDPSIGIRFISAIFVSIFWPTIFTALIYQRLSKD